MKVVFSKKDMKAMAWAWDVSSDDEYALDLSSVQVLALASWIESQAERAYAPDPVSPNSSAMGLAKRLRGMIDKRLCVACDGSGSLEISFSDNTETGARYADCPDCNGTGEVEVAPSTDEGKARKGHECDAWCVFQGWVSEIRGGVPNTDDLGLRPAFDAIAAEARAPLEERIWELEREVLGLNTILGVTEKDAEHHAAENERLRETLISIARNPMNYLDWLSDAESALTTPPSSTEGTKERGE